MWRNGKSFSEKIASLASIFGVCLLLVYINNEENFNFLDGDYLGQFEYDNPKLLQIIQGHYLDAPSTKLYNLTVNGQKSTYDEYEKYIGEYSFKYCKLIIDTLFKDSAPGFFVEAGALDGEFLSNSLTLEKDYGWKGLLVEASRENYNLLKLKQRKAWTSHCCLATKPTAHQEILYQFTSVNRGLQETALARAGARARNALMGSLHGESSDGIVPGPKVYEPVTCLPLGSLLSALGVRNVTFISLDVEGSEPPIVKHFPWKDITVDVWLVEHGVQEIEELQKRIKTRTNHRDDLTLLDPNFMDMFKHRGYVLYGASTDIRVINYVFIRKDSDTYHRIYNYR